MKHYISGLMNPDQARALTIAIEKATKDPNYLSAISGEGPVAEIFDDPKHPYTKGLLSSVPRLTGEVLAEGIPGTVPDYTESPSGCRFHPRCSHAMDGCVKQKPPMVELSAKRYVACYLYVGGANE